MLELVSRVNNIMFWFNVKLSSTSMSTSALSIMEHKMSTESGFIISLGH